MTYLRDAAGPVPQSEPMPGMVPNSAGGYSYPVDDWARLRRFLILGAQDGTYYIGERKLVRENVDAVERCIKADGARVVAEVYNVSNSGAAKSNDPALFVLAMCAKTGDDYARGLAFDSLNDVARTGTHILHFASYIELFGGWGRKTRDAVARWFTTRTAQELSFQAVKYPSRDSWALGDLLRLSHPSLSGNSALVAKYMLKGFEGIADEIWTPELPLLAAVQALRDPECTRAPEIIRESRVPREAVPTSMLNDPKVWEALLVDMPVGAMVRNLGKMSSIGLLTPMSLAENRVVDSLRSGDELRRSRLHPMALMVALKTYAQGHGERGSLTWTPCPRVVDALDAAFYTAFQNVQPTNKRIVVGIDVSGSMEATVVNGVPGMMARECAGAMALVTLATEPQAIPVCFDVSTYTPPLSARQRLDDVIKVLSATGGGGTDCSLPIKWADENLMGDAEAMVIITDSETWYGREHPAYAIQQYRRKRNVPTKIVTMAMCSNGFSLNASPVGEDPLAMDVVGFDAGAPAAVAEFLR